MAWASIILNRMKEAVDNIPRQEQTGFVRVAHVVSKFKLYAKLKKYRLQAEGCHVHSTQQPVTVRHQ